MSKEALVEQLCERLNYEFKDVSLLNLALTHPSSYVRGEINTHYERLEYLGDAVLELVVTEYLYKMLPTAPEGLMTQLRARVVGRPSLVGLARELELNKHMRLGKGEEQSGGRMRDSNLSNTFEAVIGAVFLDSNFEKVKEILLAILDKPLKAVTIDPREDNPKGELQTELQKIYPEAPKYATVENGSQAIQGKFFSTVIWRDNPLGSGYGESKRKAEVAAARDSLKQKKWLNKQ